MFCIFLNHVCDAGDDNCAAFGPSRNFLHLLLCASASVPHLFDGYFLEFSAMLQVFAGSQLKTSFAVLNEALAIETGPVIPLNNEKGLENAELMLRQKSILSFVSDARAHGHN